MTAPMYPPESHALRDLPFEMAAISASHSRAWLALDRGPAPDGVVSVGSVTTVADVLAGSLCARAIAPDWMATAALSMYLADLPGSGVLVVDARVARLGRTTLVIQLALSPDGTGDSAAAGSAGEGVASFSRLPRRESNLDIASVDLDPEARTTLALPTSGLSGTFESGFGSVVLDADSGHTVTPVLPYVQNSFGAVNGGIVAALADVAARSVVDSRYPAGPGQGPARTTDLSVQYLSQVRSGSVRTVARVVRSGHGSATLRVELSDAARSQPDPGAAAGEDAVQSAVADAAGSWSSLMAVAHVMVQFGANS